MGLVSWLAAGLLVGGAWVGLRRRPRVWRALSTGIAGALGGGLLATGLGFGGLAVVDERSVLAAALAAMLALLGLELVAPSGGPSR